MALRINRTIKNLNRITEIIGILVKYGFEEFVASTALRKLLNTKRMGESKRLSQQILTLSRWQRIRMAVEELGPTFVKLAQTLSNRPDMVPEPLIEQFEQLQDNVKPFSSAQAMRMIERELGAKLSSVFEFFYERPFASASIGQVYRARLLSGQEVIVKVQRPGIGRVIAKDIEILYLVAELTQKYFQKNFQFDPIPIVEAFEKSMTRELLYLNEAKNIVQFRNYYANKPKVQVPKVFRQFSTQKLLVMEFIKGCKITDIKQLKAFGLNPRQVAADGFELYLSQIFEHGFFHADPHPGNLLVREDGTICIIDFGMVGKLIKKDKYALSGIFQGMAEMDSKKAADNFRRLAIDDQIADQKAFEYDMNETLEEFVMLQDHEHGMSQLRKNLQNIIYKHRMKVPDAVYLLLRALVMLEGIGKTLDPDLSLRELAEPFQRKIAQEQNSPQNLANELNSRIGQLSDFLRNFPTELNQILRSLRKGKLHIQYEVQGLEPLYHRLDKITNRLALTFVSAAFLLASALTMLADYRPDQLAFWGIPYISLVGFVFSSVLLFFLLLSVLRNRGGNGN